MNNQSCRVVAAAFLAAFCFSHPLWGNDVIAREDSFSVGRAIINLDGRAQVTLDRSDAIYNCGEEAVFTVTIFETNGVKATSGKILWQLDNYGAHTFAEGRPDLAKENPFMVKGTLPYPGFLRLRILGDRGRQLRAYSAAFEPEKIRTGAPKPADFDAFWDGAIARLEKEVPLDPLVEPIPDLTKNGVTVARVSFATFGGKRVYGILSHPTDPKKGPYPLRVHCPGAGPGFEAKNCRGTRDEVMLCMSVHDFPIPGSAEERTARYEAQEAAWRKVHGKNNARAYPVGGLTESVEASHYFNKIVGINRAVSWAAQRADVDRSRVYYSGASQGGGFGLYLAALNPYIRRAYIGVPALADVLGCQADGRQSGWPRITEFETQKDPARLATIQKNAAYLDGAYFAERIRIPVRLSVGYADESCAPHAVLAAYNAIPSEDKVLYHGIGGLHGSRNAPNDLVNAWLKEPAVTMPGEPATKPAISPAPFPDALSAYVWRNWFVVPHARLAEVVETSEANLERMAVEMGLPAKVAVSGAWRRKGYITILRRNWHLLDYPQLLRLVDMTRAELSFSLMEDDFLFHKLGNLKPKCGRLVWKADAAAKSRDARLKIGRIVKEEGVDDFTEEPRFAFVERLSQAVPNYSRPADDPSAPFDFRLIFSYFADYCDPLADPEVGSFPEGLLQKLADQGVNAVWMHTVLRTLAKDPKYPEFGEGSENRIANLNKLVRRCNKYGIKVFLYMNEPRAMPDSFFRGHPEREAFRGCNDKNWPVFAMCTSCPEVRRWVRDSLKQIFTNVPGLGGIFTITMSENLTNCPSRGNQNGCPRCSKRSSSEIVAEINAAMIEGMVAGNPDATALLYDWAWANTDGGKEKVISLLPKKNVRILAVSETRIPFTRGGIAGKVGDYSIAIVGPGEAARESWRLAKANGLPSTAKVQANCSWELAAFPYLPVVDLVAEHAYNLVREGVDGVLLSWSHGCCPAPNLSIFRDIRKTDPDKGAVLDKLATDLYGEKAVPTVRKAWKAFADGYREFPFAVGVIYAGPMHMGPANPLYLKPTGYAATMVGIPYDALKSWRAQYPADIWANQMEIVADGFVKGCELFRAALPAMSGEQRAFAENELKLFRAATLHFRSSVDQARFYMAREKGDKATMRALAAQELRTAKEILPLVRGDSRFGFESSNQYFYVPQDLREKVLSCRLALED